MASASSPEVTSASASNPGVALITARAASRNSGWSSTVSTRTVALLLPARVLDPAIADHGLSRRRARAMARAGVSGRREHPRPWACTPTYGLTDR